MDYYFFFIRDTTDSITKVIKSLYRLFDYIII